MGFVSLQTKNIFLFRCPVNHCLNVKSGLGTMKVGLLLIMKMKQMKKNLVYLGIDNKCFLKSGLEGTNRTSIEGWTSGPKKCRVFG